MVMKLLTAGTVGALGVLSLMGTAACGRAGADPEDGAGIGGTSLVGGSDSSSGSAASGGAEGTGAGTGTGNGGSSTGASTGASPGAGGEAAAGAGGGVSGGGGAASASGGAGGTATTGEAVGFVVQPVVAPNPNPAVPQVGILSFETSGPATAQVLISGGGEEWTVELSDLLVQHRKAIIGLKPDTQYEFTVSAVAEGGVISVAPATSWVSPALPGDLPPFQFLQSTPSAMEPGMTLFNIRPTSGATLLVVDADGIVRWYYKSSTRAPRDGHIAMSNGHLIFGESWQRVVEIDWEGNDVVAWQATQGPNAAAAGSSVPVAVEHFHHDYSEMSSGNILGLSTEMRQIQNYPTSTTDAAATTSTQAVVGDMITEFTRAGEIVKHISLFDILDPTRVGHGSLGTHWAPYTGSPKDWSHANAVVYDESDGCYIVSVRHQDVLVKIDRETEELVWILGNPANWKAPWSDKLLQAAGAVDWFYEQHGVGITPDGVIFYDNGNNRAPAYQAKQTEYSRSVEFGINAAAMTATQLWTYGDSSGAEAVFSSMMGDADRLVATNNVLIVDASLQSGSRRYGRIQELTREGTIVFSLQVGGPDAAASYDVFTAERIADIRQQ